MRSLIVFSEKERRIAHDIVREILLDNPLEVVSIRYALCPALESLNIITFSEWNKVKQNTLHTILNRFGVKGFHDLHGEIRFETETVSKWDTHITFAMFKKYWIDRNPTRPNENWLFELYKNSFVPSTTFEFPNNSHYFVGFGKFHNVIWANPTEEVMVWRNISRPNPFR